jgi:hypothetical protein
MRQKGRVGVAVMVAVASASLSACAGPPASAAKGVEPFSLKPIDGTGLAEVKVTPLSARRIGIKTAPVREFAIGATVRKVVDYAALIYEPSGATSVYTNPKALVFVRHAVTVESNDGNNVVLSDGPPAGTPVVTVGGAQLLGMEFGVGK